MDNDATKLKRDPIALTKDSAIFVLNPAVATSLGKNLNRFIKPESILADAKYAMPYRNDVKLPTFLNQLEEDATLHYRQGELFQFTCTVEWKTKPVVRVHRAEKMNPLYHHHNMRFRSLKLINRIKDTLKVHSQEQVLKALLESSLVRDWEQLPILNFIGRNKGIATVRSCNQGVFTLSEAENCTNFYKIDINELYSNKPRYVRFSYHAVDRVAEHFDCTRKQASELIENNWAHAKELPFDQLPSTTKATWIKKYAHKKNIKPFTSNELVMIVDIADEDMITAYPKC